MDRPVLWLRHEKDGTITMRIEYPPGDRGGAIKIDPQKLIDELNFPRPYEIGTTEIPIPAGRSWEKEDGR